MSDDARLIDRQRMRHPTQIQVDPNILERRNHHLHDERLIDRHAVFGRVVGIDLPEDLVPVGQVVEHRVIVVRGGRSGEDRFEQRRQLAVGGGFVAVARDVVFEACCIVGQPALHGQAHREPPTGGDVLRHNRLEHLDHHADAGYVARGIGREVGAAARSDGVVDLAALVVERRAQHFGPEFHPA